MHRPNNRTMTLIHMAAATFAAGLQSAIAEAFRLPAGQTRMGFRARSRKSQPGSGAVTVHAGSSFRKWMRWHRRAAPKGYHARYTSAPHRHASWKEGYNG